MQNHKKTGGLNRLSFTHMVGSQLIQSGLPSEVCLNARSSDDDKPVEVNDITILQRRDIECSIRNIVAAVHQKLREEQEPFMEFLTEVSDREKNLDVKQSYTEEENNVPNLKHKSEVVSKFVMEPKRDLSKTKKSYIRPTIELIYTSSTEDDGKNLEKVKNRKQYPKPRPSHMRETDTSSAEDIFKNLDKVQFRKQYRKQRPNGMRATHTSSTEDCSKNVNKVKDRKQYRKRRPNRMTAMVAEESSMVPGERGERRMKVQQGISEEDNNIPSPERKTSKAKKYLPRTPTPSMQGATKQVGIVQNTEEKSKTTPTDVKRRRHRRRALSERRMKVQQGTSEEDSNIPSPKRETEPVSKIVIKLKYCSSKTKKYLPGTPIPTMQGATKKIGIVQKTEQNSKSTPNQVHEERNHQWIAVEYDESEPQPYKAVFLPTGEKVTYVCRHTQTGRYSGWQQQSDKISPNNST